MNSILNDKLRAIGNRIAGGSEGKTSSDIDIEDTLLDIVEELNSDGRLASLLLSWLNVHGEVVIVEKLEKFARQRALEKRNSLDWLPLAAAFMLDKGDRRWKRMARRRKEPLYLYPKSVTESALDLKGAVKWLRPLNIVVPEGAFRIRKDDVFSPAELMKRNRQYRNRYLYGPTWRADIITALEKGITRPAEIVRAVGCSYEPAHRVWRHWTLVKGAG